MVRTTIRYGLIIFAVSCVLAGIWLAVSALIKGHWLSAVTYFVAGLLAFVFWFPDLIQKTDPPITWKVGCMFATFLGFIALVNEHPTFDMDRTEGHSQALNAFLHMELSCRPMSSELDALMIEGVKACSLQNYNEMADAIGQLQNAKTFGPTLSIIDGIRSAANKPDGDWCAETYLVARDRCPFAFFSMKKNSIAALEKKLN